MCRAFGVHFFWPTLYSSLKLCSGSGVGVESEWSEKFWMKVGTCGPPATSAKSDIIDMFKCSLYTGLYV